MQAAMTRASNKRLRHLHGPIVCTNRKLVYKGALPISLHIIKKRSLMNRLKYMYSTPKKKSGHHSLNALLHTPLTPSQALSRRTKPKPTPVKITKPTTPTTLLLPFAPNLCRRSRHGVVLTADVGGQDLFAVFSRTISFLPRSRQSFLRGGRVDRVGVELGGRRAGGSVDGK